MCRKVVLVIGKKLVVTAHHWVVAAILCVIFIGLIFLKPFRFSTSFYSLGVAPRTRLILYTLRPVTKVFFKREISRTQFSRSVSALPVMPLPTVTVLRESRN
jgi:hypothetical protein